MENAPPKMAPLPSVRRLPLYLRTLKEFLADGIEQVSCTQISEELGLDSIQVRKDLSITGAVGKPKIGYETRALIASIQEFLGWNNVNNAFVIGAGSLGTALLGYSRFEEYGLNILAGFDIDPAKIGTQIHEREILPLSKLPNLVERMHVKIALLTVPGPAAQEIAKTLTAAGIQAILNFTPEKLDVPKDVIVEDVNIAASLAALSNRLAQKIKVQDETKEVP